MKPTPKALTQSLPLLSAFGSPTYVARIPAAPFASWLVPFRNEFSVFAITPSTSSRFPATLVRFTSSRSRTPAVLFSTIAVAYLFSARPTYR